MICTAATQGARAQPAQTLYHVLHDTYGCANPRATLALTNLADPRQQDPNWVSFVIRDGHCARITPRSPWRLVFRQGDLAFMTYVGTTALPASFYLKSDELAVLPSPPATPSAVGASPSAENDDAQQFPSATSPGVP